MPQMRPRYRRGRKESQPGGKRKPWEPRPAASGSGRSESASRSPCCCS